MKRRWRQSDIERAILPTYLRHLARLAEDAPVIEPSHGENLAVVAVPVDVAALREAADLLDAVLK
jgi:hypothetical protein